MRVKATATGFHGGSRIRPGEEFEVAEGAKGSWFVPIEPKATRAPVEVVTSGVIKLGAPTPVLAEDDFSDLT